MGEDGVTVLLVDDDDAFRLSLRDYLERKGYAVLVASDGVSAIKQLLDHRVDVIVSDYRMDVLGGEYWMRFLRRFCPDITVILVTGFLKAEADVPYPVLYKPFDYSDLEERIRTEISAQG
ncbi:MAG: response regulator [Spirochaetaceae bacterium]